MKKIIISLIGTMLLSGAVLAQTHKITGIVRGSENKPLVGATVRVEGLGDGTSTDAQGYFQLNVGTAKAVLKVSYVGYITKEIKVDGKTELTITLQLSDASLSGVVVVGYGTQRKENLTGSVSTISGKEVAKRPVMRASEALEGLAPGVTVTQNSGQPGADGGTIRIRGIGTLGNSDPLVLIDGVEGALDGVDPNDIESISVLKDAASASIYGSRAANGVILVTTKKGNNETVKVHYNDYFGWQKFTDLPKFADGYDYMIALNQAYRNEGKDPLYSDDYLQAYQQNYQSDPDHYPNVDWQKEVYTGSGFLQHHYLNVTGGNKLVKIMGSVAYQDQKGVVPHYSSRRYSFRFNSEMNVSDNLQLRLYLSGRHSPTFAPDASGDTRIIYRTNHTPPVYPAILTNGLYGVGWSGTNPLAFAREGGIDETDYEYLQATFQANYQPFRGADIELNFTPEYNDTWAKNFSRALDTYNPGSNVPAYTIPSKSSLSESDSRSWENTLHLLFKYHRSFGENNFHFLAGYEQIAYTNNNFGAFRDNYPLPDFQQLNAGSTENWSNNGTASEWALKSFFGRLSYDYAGKYLLEADLRRDGSSRFATGNQYGVFPAFSAGWRISEENFMKGITWLSNLKVRASWGELGNQQIGTYPFASVIGLGANYIFDGTVANGAAQTNMSNRNISWESSTTKDLGFDLGLLQNKLSMTFDYYKRNTTGILLQLPVPAIIGLNAPYQNAGVVNNRGWDLAINYANTTRKVNYNVGFNISDVRNQVIDLKGTGPYINGYTIIEEGYPINSLYGYQATGLFQSQSEVNKSPTQFGNYAPGDIKYMNLNGDSVINADDREVIGNQIPRYTFGFNFSLKYHDFDINMLLQGIGKRDVYLNNDAVWAFYNSGPIQQWQLDYWTPDNPNAKYPRLIAESNHNNFQNSSYWVYKAAYLRLKNLQIGYSMPSQLLSRLFISNLRIYLAGDNLVTFDHMPKGWDPERPSGDATYYPISSTYTFGVDITF